MKKLLIIGLVFILGVVLSVSVANAQVSVRVGSQVQVQTQAPSSYLVQPRGYTVKVNVPQYYYVQPRPYLVTPVVKPRPPKPNFRTPLRNKVWRYVTRPRVNYVITPQ